MLVLLDSEEATYAVLTEQVEKLVDKHLLKFESMDIAAYGCSRIGICLNESFF